MDPYVGDPHWGGYIVWYFFLGGIAAGAYAVAAMATLFGGEEDRRATRPAHYVAFPLVAVCGLLLTVDLNRPERFWHMLIQSETWRPMLKWWSPMSVGSWALTAFGGFSALSFLAVLIEDGWMDVPNWRDRVVALRRGWPGKLVALLGAGTAFFLGSYTGVLLSATNQPTWADTTWLGALFLASAASTGVATLVVLARWRCPDVGDAPLERLETVDGWAILLELVMLLAFAFSIRGTSGLAFIRWPGMLIPLFVVPVGLILPLALRQAMGSRGAVDSALLVLLGGFVLRFAVVGMPGSLTLKPY
ncbi:MAG: NrfD/PsrC family molybdoenzyme membrane anchor subunit [Isosphaeraceae bacterium]